jgi:hypothetical protein
MSEEFNWREFQAEMRAKKLAMLAEVKRHGLRLLLTVRGSDEELGRPEVKQLKREIEEWSNALLGLIVVQAPSQIAWIEDLAGADASSYIAGEGGKLPWPRGLCQCKNAVLVWESEPRCPQCGRTDPPSGP